MSHTELASLRPTVRQTVMELAAAAGIDVSDWKNYSRPDRPAANPSYCYQWAFLQPGKVVVLNLWYAAMKRRGSNISCEIAPRQLAEELRQSTGKAVQIARAEEMHELLEHAAGNQLPLRVIVCDGDQRRIATPGSDSSRVKHRLLDPLP